MTAIVPKTSKSIKATLAKTSINLIARAAILNSKKESVSLFSSLHDSLKNIKNIPLVAPHG
jgi:vacuolar-type H+-ATPase subunit E/Vma4